MKKTTVLNKNNYATSHTVDSFDTLWLDWICIPSTYENTNGAQANDHYVSKLIHIPIYEMVC